MPSRRRTRFLTATMLPFRSKSFRLFGAAILFVAVIRVPAAQTNPFGVTTDKDVGYPQVTPHYFFEKVDALEKNPWRYAAVGQFEVLTRCSDAATKRFVAELGRRVQVMKAVLPEKSVASFDAPIRVMLYLEDNTAEVEKWPVKTPFGLPFHLGPSADGKGLTVMVNLWPYERAGKSKPAENALVYTAAKVAHSFALGKMRTETGPWPWNPETAWLWNGLDNFCIELVYSSSKSVTFDWPPGAELSVFTPGRVLAKDELLPMESLFQGRFTTKPDPAIESVKKTQLGLFIRWGLLSDQALRREQFWKFAAHVRTHQITAALFQEYFGMSGPEIRKELGSYLRKDLPPIPAETLSKSAVASPDLPSSRAATAAEFERFKAAVNRAYDESRPRA
jgi:hypothetical protein